MAAVNEHNTNIACFQRRQKLCMGYLSKFDDVERRYTVSIFAVEWGRTPAPLGVIQMGTEEWPVFHALVYHKWENLQYPKPDDLEGE